MSSLLLLPLSYLIGSFPTAYLFGRLFKKIDIRNQGSGNVGGMNTYRTAGLLPGALTVIVDTLKGMLTVMLALSLSADQPTIFACAALVILGHNYSIFLKFKGGKGLATTLGVFIVLSPLSILFIVLCAVILSMILRDINTAFGSAALFIPLVLGLQHEQWSWILFGLITALIIALKHIPDYRAYAQGRRNFLQNK